ncbi:hypothetical protein [Paraburkholderia sp. DHOC27]|uniref:hypothetical protein n=1 Tax=Paraburkholderia sp. DHOC27 TaxID=2303330 RepID=UPI000E3B88F9|nr:hypothetical protein [Paraburkholderia sp. DHOC27]RFU45048.1 hypothetical protein D0B32_25245 [Paraburkholderia sp. DHOC27]
MRAKPCVAAVAVTVTVVAVLLSAGLAPSRAAAQAFESGSRAELYRRHVLGGKDVQCRTNASCAALGVEALNAGHIRDAQALVDMEAMLADAATLQAEEENAPKAIGSAESRVDMALVHEGDVQASEDAFANARAYYRSAITRASHSAEDPMLSRVRTVAQQRLAGIADKNVVQGPPAAGTHFARYMNLGAWSSVTLTPLKGRRGEYRLDAEFVYPSVGQDGNPQASTGSVVANVRFFGGIARVPVSDVPRGALIEATSHLANPAPYEGRPDRCLLEFRLSEPETLEVLTHGSADACGFGARVTADGAYYLKTDS